MKDGEIIKEYGYKGGNLPRRELPHKKDQEGKWVLHGPMRNYQREWVRRSVKNLTSNQLYRSDLASTVQRRYASFYANLRSVFIPFLFLKIHRSFGWKRES